MNKSSLLKQFLMAVAAAMLGGCINLKPVSDPTRFYVLSVQPAREPLPGAAALHLPVCVAKVETPAYLDNPGLAIRQDGNRITYAPFHQWAEPVHLGITRSVSEHLASLLGAGRVNPATHRSPRGDCLEVQSVVSRFETTSSGQAQLVVRWRITHTGTGDVLHAALSEWSSEGAKGAGDYNASVQALSETIGLWSQQVAKALLALTVNK